MVQKFSNHRLYFVQLPTLMEPTHWADEILLMLLGSRRRLRLSCGCDEIYGYCFRLIERRRQCIHALALPAPADCCRIAMMQPTVTETSDITKVDLSRNSIEDLPVQLSSCASFEERIKEWPSAIPESLHNLVCLKLGNNRLVM
ncbi:hypothetical protein M8C21_023672 [Ambrosia artemisiifolia]|uniref:Uncharacterized protein n=1 Tax=Ambrosia artemisiifolia TaxID=4212 RepID=A0AAD5GND6_AMBAR|nr:hypothetical protein M8C21_023672 [Ambrosia artemisiifolia]